MNTSQNLLTQLENRFNSNLHRHPNIVWSQVTQALQQHPAKLNALVLMEHTGGHPDVVQTNDSTRIVFMDCSPESPEGRRSLCYDATALASRKANKPAHSAVGLALEMGVELLTEADYALLQTVGSFDLKTSSWLHTPHEIRAAGGAIFGDKRYNRTFTYHNGAESYYGVRGFRAKVVL